MIVLAGATLVLPDRVVDSGSLVIAEGRIQSIHHHAIERPSGATWIASDQHPDHHVREGERFIAAVYNKIRRNPVLWQKTAILLVYDEHGGIYDHVPPPAVIPDGFVAQPAATGTGEEFHFDRLGVRVPSILISPWIPKGTVVNGRVFEHASIPATVTDWQ